MQHSVKQVNDIQQYGLKQCPKHSIKGCINITKALLSATLEHHTVSEEK